MKRRKSERLPACQSSAQAVQLLAEYAALQAIVEARRLAAEQAIAGIRADVDAANNEPLARCKAIYALLQPWWSVACDELTEGRRKSIELGGCQIGHRTTPPKLDYPRPEAVAIAALRDLGAADLLRVKAELDKPAILRALAPPDDAPLIDLALLSALTGAGFKAVQKDEFFIAPIPPVEAAVEVVPTPTAACAAGQVAA